MRNQLPGLARDEPVRLRVVGVAVDDGSRDGLELVRRHLVVGRHHARDVHAVGDRLPIAGDDRGADAAVLLVADELDAPVSGRDHSRAVARRVVHDVDAVDELGDARQRLGEQLLLVVRGNDDGYGLAVEHGLGRARGEPARHRIPEQRRHDPEQEADERAHEHARAPARRLRPHGHRRAR